MKEEEITCPRCSDPITDENRQYYNKKVNGEVVRVSMNICRSCRNDKRNEGLTKKHKDRKVLVCRCCGKTKKVKDFYKTSCTARDGTIYEFYITPCKQCKSDKNALRNRSKDKVKKKVDKKVIESSLQKRRAEFLNTVKDIEFREPDISRIAEYKKQSWAFIQNKIRERSIEEWKMK
jgi:hypothetical protein